MLSESVFESWKLLQKIAYPVKLNIKLSHIDEIEFNFFIFTQNLILFFIFLGDNMLLMLFIYRKSCKQINLKRLTSFVSLKLKYIFRFSVVEISLFSIIKIYIYFSRAVNEKKNFLFLYSGTWASNLSSLSQALANSRFPYTKITNSWRIFLRRDSYICHQGWAYKPKYSEMNIIKARRRRRRSNLRPASLLGIVQVSQFSETSKGAALRSNSCQSNAN